jgi:hypothetical protein
VNWKTFKKKTLEGENRANRHVTLRQLHQIIPEVSKATIHEALTEKLGIQNFAHAGCQRILTDDHKTKRKVWALNYLTRYAQ